MPGFSESKQMQLIYVEVSSVGKARWLIISYSVFCVFWEISTVGTDAMSISVASWRGSLTGQLMHITEDKPVSLFLRIIVPDSVQPVYSTLENSVGVCVGDSNGPSSQMMMMTDDQVFKGTFRNERIKSVKRKKRQSSINPFFMRSFSCVSGGDHGRDITKPLRFFPESALRSQSSGTRVIVQD